MVAAQSASHEGMLASNIVDRCACGAFVRAADTVGEVEPGFGNDGYTCFVGNHRGAFCQIMAGSGPAPVLEF